MASTTEHKKPSALALGLIAAYVAIVLLVDTLAALEIQTPFDWRVFQWTSDNGFDWFKFVTWFVVPFALCMRGMDWGFFGFNRWKRRDWILLIGLGVLGLLAVLTINMFPSLREYYPSYSDASWSRKWEIVGRGMLWTFSWLIGWEFLHRYFLLRPFAARWPRLGWLIVPFSEGVYHLQKAPLEAAGMVVFSLILTAWALRRRNALLPFLAHLVIEIEVVLFMVLA